MTLADANTLANLPFDIRGLMMVSYDAMARNESDLVTVIKAAIGGLLNLLDPQSRAAIAAGGKIPGERVSLAGAQLSFNEIDFPGTKAIASKQMELQNCENRNIDPYEDGSFKGWRLRARCSGGHTMIVYITINGNIHHIDLES